MNPQALHNAKELVAREKLDFGLDGELPRWWYENSPYKSRLIDALQAAFPDGERFYDYKHKETGAPVLKAQHPEFEMWSQGVHARSGVACADCHMPYVREGALKVSDHHVRSPLLDISRACQTCHRFPEAEMRARVVLAQVLPFAGLVLLLLAGAWRAGAFAHVAPRAICPWFAIRHALRWASPLATSFASTASALSRRPYLRSSWA